MSEIDQLRSELEQARQWIAWLSSCHAANAELARHTPEGRLRAQLDRFQTICVKAAAACRGEDPHDHARNSADAEERCLQAANAKP